MNRDDVTRSSLTLKLRPGADLEQVLSGLEGILQSTPAFPEDSDPDLATVFRIEVETAIAGDIKSRLEASPSVDYVEEPVKRRLIKPRRPSPRT